MGRVEQKFWPKLFPLSWNYTSGW